MGETIGSVRTLRDPGFDEHAAAGAIVEVPPFFATVFAGFILFGAAIPWLEVALISLVQRLTPSELQGRAYSAVDMLITVPQTISIALGAGLIVVTGYRALLVAMAVVMGVAAAYILTRPERHHSRSVLEPRETEMT